MSLSPHDIPIPKKGNLILVLVLTLSASASAQQQRIVDLRDSHGWFGTVEDNELELVSTFPDPTKIRFAIDAGKVESNLGALSWNMRRTEQEGALYFAVRNRSEQSVREVFYLDPSAAIFRVPVYAPNLGGGGGVSDHLQAAANSLYIQADGNFVIYERVGETQCQRWAITWIGSSYRNGSGYIDPTVLEVPCR